MIALLSSHRGVDDREVASIARFLATVPELAEPCAEGADIRHVTASAIVVCDEGDAVVLHLHKRLGIWLQPGGHIDHGERPADAALREATEETGLEVRHHGGEARFVHVDVHPGPRGHTHFDLRYLLRAPRRTPSPGAGESPEVAWFSWQEAEAIADAGLIGALRATKALLHKGPMD